MTSVHRAPWTSEQISALHALSQEGLTAREIGRQLGRTRRAIIGQRFKFRHEWPATRVVPAVKLPSVVIPIAEVARAYELGWRVADLSRGTVTMEWRGLGEVR